MTWKLPDWSREARLSSQIWFGMDVATRFILFNRWGKQPTYDLEFEFMRKHQLTHFLDGTKKLGIEKHPHHVLAAEYHCLSNLLGGLDMGFQDDGDRAWVFYMPPSAFAGSPLLATPAAPKVPAEIMVQNFKAWHANNGVLLGNDRLRFVATDLMFAGGPYDAGYWEEASRPLAPDERLIIKFGQERGRPGPPPNLGSALWPQARRDSALRKYNAEYAIGGFAEITKHRGLAEAVIIAEESHQAVFLAWSRILLNEFKIEEPRSDVRVATLMRKSFELIQDEFEEQREQTSVALLHKKSRLRVPQYPGWETMPIEIEQAFARAWTVISRAVGDPVKVTIEASRSSGAPATVWRFKPEN